MCVTLDQGVSSVQKKLVLDNQSIILSFNL